MIQKVTIMIYAKFEVNDQVASDFSHVRRLCPNCPNIAIPISSAAVIVFTDLYCLTHAVSDRSWSLYVAIKFHSHFGPFFSFLENNSKSRTRKKRYEGKRKRMRDRKRKRERGKKRKKGKQRGQTGGFNCELTHMTAPWLVPWPRSEFGGRGKLGGREGSWNEGKYRKRSRHRWWWDEEKEEEEGEEEGEEKENEEAVTSNRKKGLIFAKTKTRASERISMNESLIDWIEITWESMGMRFTNEGIDDRICDYTRKKIS